MPGESDPLGTPRNPHRSSASWVKSVFSSRREQRDVQGEAARGASDGEEGSSSSDSSASGSEDDEDADADEASKRARRRAARRRRADRDPNLIQRAAKSAQHYGASLFDHGGGDEHQSGQGAAAPVAIPSAPRHREASSRNAAAGGATMLSSSPSPSASADSHLSSSPLTTPPPLPSSSPRPTPSSSGSFKGVGATLSTLQSRYAMRRQASQTFKEMQHKAGSSATTAAAETAAPRSLQRQPQRSTSLDAPATATTATTTRHASPHRPSLDSSHSDSNILDSTTTASTSSPRSSAVPLLDVPRSLQTGEGMLKVTHKKVMQRVIRLDADRGQILWASKKGNRINLEAVREVRIGASGASFRTSLNISAAHEPRWISIIYQQGAAYKALHLIALSDESLVRWRDALERLQGLRRHIFGAGAGHAAAALGLDVSDLQSNKNDIWLRQHWKTADSSADERLDPDEVVRLCRRLGIESSRSDLQRRFEQADWRKRGFLDFEDFQLFVRLLKRRNEVERLFETWADLTVTVQSRGGVDGAHGQQQQQTQRAMSLSTFERFLHDEQESNAPPTSLFSKYCSKAHGALLLEGFSSFLQSADNGILKDASMVVANANDHATATKPPIAAPSARATADTAEALLAAEAQLQTSNGGGSAGAPRVAPQDMRRPLSEYFISSSHNTYLVGGQWKGDSTVEGYIRALQHGARSVELDCWDGPHGQPQITHGRTLTSRVAFFDVIAAIGKYAFVTSPYPLILSLEVHNDVPQQTVMAKMLRDVLGDALLTEKLSSSSAGDDTRSPVTLALMTTAASSSALPSPEDLRGKILVKAKNILVSEKRASAGAGADADAPVPALVTTSNADTTTTGSESEGLFANAKELVRSVTRSGRSSRESTRGNADSSATTLTPDKPKKVLFSPDLAALLVYTIGVKHRGINKKETYAPEHMISLSERTAFKYVRDRSNREDLIKHNRSHLTRVYPSMSSLARLHASANYLPHHIWAVGCQLVALNWQTIDLGFALNQAMFSRNAGTGYVLKPPALRFKDQQQQAEAAAVTTKCTLEVQVVSAQQLPRFRDVVRDKESTDGDVLDPFIAVSLLTPESWGRQDQESAAEASISPTATPPPPPPSSRSTPRLATHVVRGNGFNPVWNSTLRFTISVPGGANAVEDADDAATPAPHLRAHAATRGLLDLAFLRFEVCEDVEGDAGGGGGGAATAEAASPSESALPPPNTAGTVPAANTALPPPSSTSPPVDTSNLVPNQILATYTISVGALQMGYRHLPLYDGQLQQYPFSTLFVRSKLRAAREG